MDLLFFNMSAWMAVMRLLSIWFLEAFSSVPSTAAGSISRQNADFAPHCNAVMARIPLPHPASRIVVSGVMYFRRDRRQSFVVS